MPYVDTDNGRLNYAQVRCEENPEAEYLILIHGLATNLAFWYMQYASVFSKHFHVVLFDLKGHGRSSMPSSGYTPQSMATDLYVLMNALAIEKAHLAAHSFGGVVALNFAARQPERVLSVVLADTHLRAFRGNQPWPQGEEIVAKLREVGIEISLDQPYFGHRVLYEVACLREQGRELSDDLSASIAPIIGNLSKKTAKQWLKLLSETQAKEELMADDGLDIATLKRVTCPVLCVYGEYSQAMQSGKALLQVWPHGEFRKMRAAGHFFPATKAGSFAGICEKFWLTTRSAQARLRKYESASPPYFRSMRFEQSDAGWMVYCREGEFGPFTQRELAEQCVDELTTRRGEKESA